ncbi:hypothetical protein DTL42_20165 [Bremerella cremea]|uniref:Uncharacterized protein n=1 Tax=Bremerella cremea TaxID=1031537 RepID=A0A368KLQ9_9BACT|nr:hypothetical protein [Bremerella cremea]RCS42148.1 hypothetical protein DTL42_20165 [Bremerella cremea]
MRDAFWKSLIVLGIFYAAAQQALGQPLVAKAESIESAVINADLVLVAKLVHIGEAKQVDGREFYNTNISIVRNLKQDLYLDEPHKKLQAELLGPAAVLADWKDRSCDLLVLIYNYEPYATKVIELAPGKMEVMKADFTLLREPEAVLNAAEQALQRTPPAIKRLHTFELHVPRNLIANTQWDNYFGLFLNVPVDQQLEKRAIKYLRSENYNERKEGARALRYFRSDENIARLKTLLQDPGWGYLRHPADNNGIEVRYYGVRDSAYLTLKSWDVEVDKPETQETILRSPPDNKDP